MIIQIKPCADALIPESRVVVFCRSMDPVSHQHNTTYSVEKECLALVLLKNFWNFGIAALLFVFDNYYPIMG